MEIVIVYVVVVILLVICWVNIYEKAGYNKWLGLLMLVPVVNFIAMLMFAFDEWPVGRGAASNVSSPKCHKCKRQVEHDWRVCPYCKEVLVIKCQKCNKDIARDWAACAYCGEEFVLQSRGLSDGSIRVVKKFAVPGDCPACGESVQLLKDFCNHCGTRLDWNDAVPYIKYTRQCPSCKKQIPTHLKTCLLCGADLSWEGTVPSVNPLPPSDATKTKTSQCPMCGDMISENWKACPRCGEKLHTDEQYTTSDAKVGTHK